MITTNIDGKALISSDVIAGECRTFKAKLRFGTVDYDGLYSFTYTSYISPQRCTLGCTPSAMFKCEIVDLSSSASSLKNQVFNVLISLLDADDWINLGEFKITDATMKDGIYSITAYDKMNFVRDKPYIPTIKGRQLIFNVFKDICTQIDNEGITDGFTKIAPVSFSDTANIDPSALSGYPLKDALSYLCAYAGRNCLVNRSGAFEARQYTAHTSYQLLNDDRIETPELDEFDSQVQSLTALTSDEDVLSAGTSTAQGITFLCPTMTQNRLNDLYNKDFGLASNDLHLFRAGKVNQILGDPRLEVGDVIPLTHEGKKYNIPVMSLKIDYDGGLMSEIESFSFGDDEGVSLAQKVDFALKKSKDISKYAQASSDLSGVIAGGLGLYKTELPDESGAIRTYMHDKPQLEDSAYIATFNSKGFAWTVNGWNNGNPVWSDGVDTTASSMVIRAITAHSITADKIDVTDLSAFDATIGGFCIAGNGTAANGFWGHSISSIIKTNATKVDADNPEYAVFMRGQGKNSNGALAGAYQPTNVVFGVKERTDALKTWDDSPYNFYVRADGFIKANNANITGEITATSLTLGSNVKVPYSSVSGTPDLTVYQTKTGAIIRGTYQSGSTGIKISSSGLLEASNAVIYGTIYASQGTIAGWNITGSRIEKDNTSNGGYRVGIQSGASETSSAAFYAGCNTASGGSIANKSSSNFYVTHAGHLYAKSADIEGSIIATSGTIGGWTINTDYIISDKSNYNVALCNFNNANDNSRVLYCQKKSDNSYTFRLYRDGSLLATKATITGNITATSGKIGGWNIGSSSYYSTAIYTTTADNHEVGIKGSSGNNDLAFYVKDSSGSNVFYVNNSGKLLAQNADIKGTITATSGSFTSTRTSNDSAVSIKNGNLYLEYYSRLCFVKPNNEGTNIVMRYEPPPNEGNADHGVLFGIDSSPLHLYGYGIWEHNGLTSGSDRRIKKDIHAFDERYEKMFSLLNPVTFKYIDGTSDRTHFGFIAQDVLSSAQESELTSTDIAAYVNSDVKSDNDSDCILGLRYSEFISLNTHMIQKCLKEIAELKVEISLLKSERI